MAKARRSTTTVEKRVPSIQLTLTEGEADFLQAILSKIGGDHVRSPRKYQAPISNALAKATGNAYIHTDAYKVMRASGMIMFENYDNNASLPAVLRDYA